MEYAVYELSHTYDLEMTPDTKVGIPVYKLKDKWMSLQERLDSLEHFKNKTDNVYILYQKYDNKVVMIQPKNMNFTELEENMRLQDLLT